ncbi:hypothetical protein K438DRAFT_1994462 [Mycena galopus ATCC 62051]|nr:hypothetical protein K438DRAFT_1994462 [Mycena galopus ATCC 62051]
MNPTLVHAVAEHRKTTPSSRGAQVRSRLSSFLPSRRLELPMLALFRGLTTRERTKRTFTPITVCAQVFTFNLAITTRQPSYLCVLDIPRFPGVRRPSAAALTKSVVEFGGLPTDPWAADTIAWYKRMVFADAMPVPPAAFLRSALLERPQLHHSLRLLLE